MDRAHTYTSERQLLNDFHVLVQDCQVLTTISMDLIYRVCLPVCFGCKCIPFYGIIHPYDLPGFKLDDVARMKLNETKVPVQSTGLWSWYTQPRVTAHLLQQNSAEKCYSILKPSPVDIQKYASMLFTINQTYQGALNYCIPEKAYENVSVRDFASMDPSALLSSNLCYGTCTIMTREEGRADVAQREASKWVMDAQECQWVNYEQLFISQKKMFCMLLNMAFWKLPEVPLDMCDIVLNEQRWKQFVQAELLFWHKSRAQGEPRNY
ncbi:DNA polymerase [Trichonephila inaurata madagascariensis]|uniref:DNA polymerase n=1 Tax=Trichonephila inaurata madagascariensis TaxID=2747483 RepID=A0A8X6X9B7_9ARAC|nr:DNA polymerase [Trichonephila inaurata madagascariensis]